MYLYRLLLGSADSQGVVGTAAASKAAKARDEGQRCIEKAWDKIAKQGCQAESTTKGCFKVTLIRKGQE
jgi:hypothetical protein